jgi:hypothetical protein
MTASQSRCNACRDLVARGALHCQECDRELRKKRTDGPGLALQIFNAGRGRAPRRPGIATPASWHWKPT